ncbi:hypothetical protein E5K93_07190 [Helicobacter pylori]|nr:hypothetical protein [Helicobacter pylori]WRC74230.1 hypothetical protein E5K93_07190 [Helicobacter pylori]
MRQTNETEKSSNELKEIAQADTRTKRAKSLSHPHIKQSKTACKRA